MKNKDLACVIVLGDLGRSPRMQYHIESLLENGFNVDVISYVDSKPLDTITESPRVRVHELQPFPDMNLAPILKYMFKTVWQSISLMVALLTIRVPSFLLIQNPPAVPTLVVCFFYKLFSRTKIIIDWHNYTHTILSLSATASKRSLVVVFAKWIESYFGRKADKHLCVTEAMQKDLEENWGIRSTVLYDRPPMCFQPCGIEKKHELFMKLSKDYGEFSPENCSDFKQTGIQESTVFTQKLDNDSISYKQGRPAILISSTSWTPDEDFGILLDALEEYEKIALNSNDYPKLVCIITGKGPEKQLYERKIREINFEKVLIVLPWLETEDYPTALASADLGVCLHWSSSGLDLPMKVADMFGCELPVCAIDFKCLNELIVHNKNGFVFTDSQSLAQQLKLWFFQYPHNSHVQALKGKVQQNLKAYNALRWSENWNTNALPVIQSVL